MDAVAARMNSYVWAFGDQDPDALREIGRRVAATGRKQRLLVYSDLVHGLEFRLPSVNGGNPFQITPGAWTDLHRAIVGDFLGRLCVDTYRRGRFMGSALVVARDTQQPSYGFRKFMSELGLLGSTDELAFLALWSDQVQKAYTWYSHNEW